VEPRQCTGSNDGRQARRVAWEIPEHPETQRRDCESRRGLGYETRVSAGQRCPRRKPHDTPHVSAFPSRLALDVRAPSPWSLAVRRLLRWQDGGARRTSPPKAHRVGGRRRRRRPRRPNPRAGPSDELLIEKAVACVEKGRVNRGLRRVRAALAGREHAAPRCRRGRQEPARPRWRADGRRPQGAGADAARAALPGRGRCRGAAAQAPRRPRRTPALKADILEALATRTAPGVDEAALKLLQSRRRRARHPRRRGPAARVEAARGHRRAEQAGAPEGPARGSGPGRAPQRGDGARQPAARRGPSRT
jgi:hypothetical protein